MNRKTKNKILVLKIISIFIVLPALVFSAVMIAEKNGFFSLREVRIVLKNSPDNPYFYAPLAEKLQKKLNVLNGNSLWKLKISEVIKKVSQELWVNKVLITREWPDSLLIEIEPEVIKALYSDGGGKFTPVADEGKLLNPIDSSAAPDVVVLKGPEFEKNQELRKKAIEMVSSLPESGSFSRRTISDVRFDERNGFWVSLVKNGMNVRLGEGDFPNKAKRVSEVLEYMQNKNIEGRVIDADFSKKVLVKLRKEP